RRDRRTWSIDDQQAHARWRLLLETRTGRRRGHLEARLRPGLELTAAVGLGLGLGLGLGFGLGHRHAGILDEGPIRARTVLARAIGRLRDAQARLGLVVLAARGRQARERQRDEV